MENISFELIIHSLEEKYFVKDFKGLSSILKDIYMEKQLRINKLNDFNKFLSLLFHNITNYIDIDLSIYKKNVRESVNEAVKLIVTI